MRPSIIFQTHVRAKFQGSRLRQLTLFCIVLVFFLFNIFLYNFSGWINMKWLKAKKWTSAHINSKKVNHLLKPKSVPYCYKDPQEDDDVLNLPNYEVVPNSIFFLEASCRHGEGINLTVRQACAFESAARAHPNSEILVLFPSPISLQNPTLLVSQLLKYTNIKLLHIDMDRYFANTPLENFQMQRKMAQSKWPESHASDVLRILTLWKYGGTYLDTDVIILRPINMMNNFAGAESLDLINGAILNLNISGRGGRQIIDEMILEIRDSFLPNVFYYNGPGVISRVLSRICNESDFRKMTPEKCNGFTVFPPPPASPFYRVPYHLWRIFFDQEASPFVLDYIAKSYALHMWNYMSKDARVKVHSRMPYSVFASRFCLRVHSTVVDYF